MWQVFFKCYQCWRMGVPYSGNNSNHIAGICLIYVIENGSQIVKKALAKQ